MAVEHGPIYVDDKDVTTAGTPEALTDRNILCSSVAILPKSGNVGDILLVDSVTPSKTAAIPAGGITIAVNRPAAIQIDVTNSGDGVKWFAV